MDNDGLEVTIVEEEGVRRLMVRGELDIATAPVLLARLEDGDGGAPAPVLLGRLEEGDGGAPAPAGVRLDLREVSFIDSSGLEALLAAHRRLGDALTILPSAACTRLLEITGLSETLPIARD